MAQGKTYPKQDRTLVLRALKAYADADPSVRTQGRAWYAQARAWCERVGRECNADPSVVADVTAALSPRISWRANQRLARALLTGGPLTGAMRASVTRALGAQAGAGVGNGPKVQAFAANLRGDLNRVTVDVWVCRALGLPEPTSGITHKQYARIERAIQRAAAQVGETPADFQAILWVAARGRVC